MESSDIHLLVDMGFPRDRALKALSVTGNKGVEAAMEWLLAHAEELENEVMRASIEQNVGCETNMEVAASAEAAIPADPVVDKENTDINASKKDDTGGGTLLAKSLKCDECNKLFRTNAEVEFHAAKTKHSQFSESTEEKKPLTEEEKQTQMRLIEEKMKQKRKEREEREKQEALERERNRIRTGKEITAAKKKLEDEEMKKVLDARKREKEEERIARQRVRDQIEADKAARRAKAAQAAAPATDKSVDPPAVQQPTSAPTPLVPTVQKDYTQTKLQIRLMNGNTLMQTFSCKEQLSAVRLYVEMNRTDGEEPFNFMTNFPRKVFTSEDYEKPLDVLGLVPSAVIILVKAQQ